MNAAVKSILGLPKYGSASLTPPGISKGRWLLGIGLVVAVVAMLIGWLMVARSQGESALVSFLPQLNTQRSELSQALTRSGSMGEDINVTSFYAIPRYLKLIDREDLIGSADAPQLVFLVTEDTHIGAQLPDLPDLYLKVDGATMYQPAEIKSVSEAFHHRVSIVTFPGVDADGNQVLDGANTSLALVTASGAPLSDPAPSWALPLESVGELSQGNPLTVGLFVTLFAGLLASMWPCLFQLTAYFIPTIAGLSMEQIEGKGVAFNNRFRVLKTALWFVLGFTLVYTIIGGLAGYAGSSLGSTAWVDSLRRPISIFAGVLIMLFALRLAVNARAPFVCHMPMVGGLASRKGTGPIGTMLTGLVFASGCMTCFGAAVLVGIVAYVGTTGSILLGAGLLFLFSLGIGLPLVIAAVAMARILPLLGRLEKVAPYMALVSAGIMVIFGVLMITNQLHVMTGLVYQGLPSL